MKIALFFLSCMVYLVSAEDYCNPDLCKRYVGDDTWEYDHHIGCDNSGAFLPACPADAFIVPMTHKLKQHILKLHNDFRNKVAGGNLEGFESALRMPTVKWNEELAQLAELNTKQCHQAHDACHNTQTFAFSGQNIATRKFYDMSSDETNIDALYESWIKEHNYADQSQIDVCQNIPAILHFTVIVHEKVADIGCAMSRFNSPSGEKKFYLVCNYGYTNLQNEPIYRKGPACSECKTGCNPEYPSLCNPHEKVQSIPDLLLHQQQ